MISTSVLTRLLKADNVLFLYHHAVMPRHFAKRAAGAIKSEDPALTAYAERIQKGAETEMGKALAACVAKGAAFHHAGLGRPERSIVEEGFRKGSDQMHLFHTNPCCGA